MSQIVSYEITPNGGTTLRKVLKQNLTPYLEDFESISAAASKVRRFWKSVCVYTGCTLFFVLNYICPLYYSLQEFSLEKAMKTMVGIWDSVSFHHQPYRETGVSILTALDDIQTMLDDQIVKTQTMRGSPFIKPFENEIKVNMSFIFA